MQFTTAVHCYDVATYRISTLRTVLRQSAIEQPLDERGGHMFMHTPRLPLYLGTKIQKGVAYYRACIWYNYTMSYLASEILGIQDTLPSRQLP